MIRRIIDELKERMVKVMDLILEGTEEAHSRIPERIIKVVA